ncbi:MAG: adenosine deaminase [Bifidobacteriaceae bacterium]|jgi:adenosine deaminase|nr:adenosine deaminase [Bifidobacteriaceae bacterium]
MRNLATLPKAHLHLHFTGSMATSTLMNLATEAGRHLPESLLTPRSLRLAPGERGWFRFQRLYDTARALVRTEVHLRRIVSDAASADAAEGSGRLELQVDPTTYARHLGGITPVMEIILDEARTASRDTGVEVGVIVAASRLRNPLDARTLARLAARHAGEGPGDVVAFGLSNDETAGATPEFAPAFAIARRAGLACVPHAGELRGAAHVASVLHHLRPDRLGHGVRAVEDPAVLRHVIDAGVAFEVCPSSNVALGVFDHVRDVPLRTLVEAGATVALSADDPMIFGARLTDQYRLAREVHGFSDAELAGLARSSIAASRAGEATKARLTRDVATWLSCANCRVAGARIVE